MLSKIVVKCVKKEMIWGNRSTNGTIKLMVGWKKILSSIFFDLLFNSHLRNVKGTNQEMISITPI